MLRDVVHEFGQTLGLPELALDALGRLSLTVGQGEQALVLTLARVPEGLLFGLGQRRELFPANVEEQALRLCAEEDVRPLLRPARQENGGEVLLWLIRTVAREECRADTLCLCLSHSRELLNRLRDA